MNSVVSTASALSIRNAGNANEIAQARELFLEYANSLGFSLCFQNFDEELANLPGDYAPPDGRLLLAYVSNELAGSVAMHKITEHICEMKRLYLRPQFRGEGFGRMLADAVIAEARNIGYKFMRLDTVEPVMKDAVAMYRNLGFYEIEPYRTNPMPGTVYLQLNLS